MAGPEKKEAYVTNPEIFRKLMGSIDNYIIQNKENVMKVDDWIFEKENELHKVKELLEQRLMDANTNLQNCDMELNFCRSMPDYDDEGRPKKPDCSSQKWARIEAKKQLDVAQKVISQFNELMRYAHKFANEYDEKKHKFMQLLDNKLPSSISTLGKHHQIMEEYINLTLQRHGQQL